MCDQQRLRPACAYSQTDQSLCWSLKYSMTVKLLTEPHFRFLNIHEISNNVVCATSKGSDQPAHTCRLIRAFDWSRKYSMTVKLLTEPHFRFLSLKGGCTGSSESILVKMSHSWKSRVMAHIRLDISCESLSSPISSENQERSHRLCCLRK